VVQHGMPFPNLHRCNKVLVNQKQKIILWVDAKAWCSLGASIGASTKIKYRKWIALQVPELARVRQRNCDRSDFPKAAEP
jgi:hypothetical protein